MRTPKMCTENRKNENSKPCKPFWCMWGIIKNFSSHPIILISFSLAIVSTVAYVYYNFVENYFFIDSKDIFQSAGQFGDMFGGLNSIFSGLALATLFFTAYMQREELRAQKKEILESKNERLLQKFEAELLILVDRHVELVRDFKITIGTNVHSGKSCFSIMIDMYARSVGQLSMLDMNPKSSSDAYLSVHAFTLSQLDSYFNNLQLILYKLHKMESLFGSEHSSFYASMIISMLGGPEKEWIYLEISHGISRETILPDLLRHYHVLDRAPGDFIYGDNV